MSFSRDALLRALAALHSASNTPSRYIIAFSGGLDSTVLLHALTSSAAQHGIPLQAVHIDHGLHADHADWSEHCRVVAAELDVEFHATEVEVDTEAGKGPEAAARDARYAVFKKIAQPGDWVLSAHHQEDQAETLLLNLFRGGGPAGLAGIAPLRRLGKGWLARPMLSFSKETLRDYAALHDLHWIEDPSNQDRGFDRNYLRHEVLPRIESRWPGAAQRLFRSSQIASDAAALLQDMAAVDAAHLGDRPDRLNLVALNNLSIARQRNVLRYALNRLGMATPSAAQLQRVLDEVVHARADAEPVLKWSGVEVRRYRDQLYLLDPDVCRETAATLQWRDQAKLELGAGQGYLVLEPESELGLAPELLESGLQLRFREGGERIRLPNQSHTKSVKKLLQESGVVPWMRDRIPLLFAEDELVAIGDLWVADAAAQKPGTAIRWRDRPPIH